MSPERLRPGSTVQVGRAAAHRSQLAFAAPPPRDLAPPPAQVWSMGVIMLEALIGELPFAKATSFISQVHAICQGEPAPPPRVRRRPPAAHANARRPTPALPTAAATRRAGTSEDFRTLVRSACARRSRAPTRGPTSRSSSGATGCAYAEDGSDEERCARIKAFIDEQLGES